MSCGACGGETRATDRHCPSCGSSLASGRPSVVTDAFKPSSTIEAKSRRGIFRLRWLLPVIVIAVVAVVALRGGEGEEVPEDPSSSGYSFVRDMDSRGEIDSFKAVEPDEGWEIQYSLNGGDGVIRFRRDTMEFEIRGSNDELEAAIRAAASRAGYIPS